MHRACGHFLAVPLSPSRSTVAGVTATFFRASTTRVIDRSPYFSGGSSKSIRLVRSCIASSVRRSSARETSKRSCSPAERLLQKVEGAELHGLDRGIDRSVRGEHDHFEIRVQLPSALEQREAAHARHLQIRDHEVETEPAERRQRAFSVVRPRSVVARRLEHVDRKLAEPFFVIDDEYPAHVTPSPGSRP